MFSFNPYSAEATQTKIGKKKLDLLDKSLDSIINEEREEKKKERREKKEKKGEKVRDHKKEEKKKDEKKKENKHKEEKEKKTEKKKEYYNINIPEASLRDILEEAGVNLKGYSISLRAVPKDK